MAIYKTLVKKISVSADMKTKQKEYLKKGKLAIVDQGQQLIGGYSDNENKKVDCSLPVIVFGDHTRCVKYISFPFGAGADGTKILAPQEGILPKYLYYGTQYLVLRMPDKGYARHYQHLEKMDLPVPKIEIQERVVDKIEELFSELDSGVGTLIKTKEQLGVYRQAVLKCAFEGKYTEKYRKDDDDSSEIDFESIQKPNQVYKDTAGDENEIKLNIPISWKKTRIGDIFTVDIGATPKRSIPDYWRGDICWVSSGEVKFCSIYDTEEKITQSGVDNSSTNIQPIGTVLLAMIGEGKTRGQSAILGVPAAHNQNTAAILVSQTPCDPKFVYYFLMLNYENTRRVGSGNNQKALNKDRVRALHIPFASFKEQKLVVEEIEVRFSTCDNIEKTIDEALERAEALRQCILKKAFEGEL